MLHFILTILQFITKELVYYGLKLILGLYLYIIESWFLFNLELYYGGGNILCIELQGNQKPN